MALLDTISSAYTTAKDAVKSNYQTAVNSAKTPNAPNLYTPRGGRTSFDDGKYDIKNHSYPSDLMAADGRYGGNYVMFYINVATDSKLLKGPNAAATLNVGDYPPRDRGELIAQNMSKQGLVAANAVVNIAGATAVGAALGAPKTGAAVAGLATVGTGVAATMAPDAVRSQKRLKTAIALHIPNQLSIKYGVSWSEEDASLLAKVNAGGTEILKALSGEGNLKDATGTAAAIISNIALTKTPMGAATGAALGIAANPKKEQMFKGVDFRTFSFEYQFFPRNITEADNILKIIEEFKYHMHPEFKDNNNFIYIYPSEFDIMYFNGGQENKNLHRHTSCVLTDMDINYTPNGLFSTFPNGMPTQININLNFREISLLTKDKVKDGL